MNPFERLNASFGANWATVLVGWSGLGTLSPWPDRWTEFPPLIVVNDIIAYADKRLGASSEPAEQTLIVALSTADFQNESRERIRDLLIPLSQLDGGDPELELRKWRLVLLEQALENMPKDALYGLLALTEFWQSFGFPPDSPHEVQGRGNTIGPGDYYQEENLHRIVDRHHAWIVDENSAIKKDSAKNRNQGPIPGRK